jgi:ariadne-1
MEEMQQTSDLSWIEVQFLKKAVDVTVQCRTTLKWTYAFAFYLARTNQTELFEVSTLLFSFLIVLIFI